MSDQFVSVVIPVYNEEAAIKDVIRQIHSTLEQSEFDFEILIVDDGSTDRTAAWSKEAGARVLSLPRNRGVGLARTRGVQQAKGDIIVMTDGDGSYPAEALPDILRGLKDCDMVVGARTEEAGTLKFLRRPVKFMVRRLAEYMTRSEIKDLNSGMRSFRRKDALRFLYLLPESHSWVSTITLAYLANEFEVQYTPISYHKRVGRSTFHPIGDTYNTLSLMARTVMYFFPLRIFIPAALFLFWVGIIKSLHSVFWSVGRLQQLDIVILLASLMVTAIGLLGDLIVVHGRRLHMHEEQPRL